MIASCTSYILFAEEQKIMKSRTDQDKGDKKFTMLFKQDIRKISEFLR